MDFFIPKASDEADPKAKKNEKVLGAPVPGLVLRKSPQAILEFLSNAFDSLEKTGGSRRDELLLEIIQFYATHGYPELAFPASHWIDPSRKIKAFRCLLFSFLKKNEIWFVDDIRAKLEPLFGPAENAELNFQIATFLGDTPQGRRYLNKGLSYSRLQSSWYSVFNFERIQDQSEYDKTLYFCVEALTHFGQLDDALELLKFIRQIQFRIPAEIKLALGLVDANRVKEINHLVPSISTALRWESSRSQTESQKEFSLDLIRLFLAQRMPGQASDLCLTLKDNDRFLRAVQVFFDGAYEFYSKGYARSYVLYLLRDLQPRVKGQEPKEFRAQSEVEFIGNIQQYFATVSEWNLYSVLESCMLKHEAQEVTSTLFPSRTKLDASPSKHILNAEKVLKADSGKFISDEDLRSSIATFLEHSRRADAVTILSKAVDKILEGKAVDQLRDWRLKQLLRLTPLLLATQFPEVGSAVIEIAQQKFREGNWREYGETNISALLFGLAYEERFDEAREIYQKCLTEEYSTRLDITQLAHDLLLTGLNLLRQHNIALRTPVSLNKAEDTAQHFTVRDTFSPAIKRGELSYEDKALKVSTECFDPHYFRDSSQYVNVAPPGLQPFWQEAVIGCLSLDQGLSVERKDLGGPLPKEYQALVIARLLGHFADIGCDLITFEFQTKSDTDTGLCFYPECEEILHAHLTPLGFVLYERTEGVSWSTLRWKRPQWEVQAIPDEQSSSTVI